MYLHGMQILTSGFDFDSIGALVPHDGIRSQACKSDGQEWCHHTKLAVNKTKQNVRNQDFMVEQIEADLPLALAAMARKRMEEGDAARRRIIADPEVAIFEQFYFRFVRVHLARVKHSQWFNLISISIGESLRISNETKKSKNFDEGDAVISEEKDCLAGNLFQKS